MGKHSGPMRDRHWAVIERPHHSLFTMNVWTVHCLTCGHKQGPYARGVARLYAKLHMAMSAFIVAAWRAGKVAGMKVGQRGG